MPPRGDATTLDAPDTTPADERDRVSGLLGEPGLPGPEAAAAAIDALSSTRRAAVVGVANQKGGVGKTTTAVSLAAALASDGAQVLLIDLDPQGNATTGLGRRAAAAERSSYAVLVDRAPIDETSEATAVRGLHLVPASLDLAGAEIELVGLDRRERRLRDAVEGVRDLYDVVVLDCPPSLGLLTVNALAASDELVVPIQCEYYALEGLGQLLRTVDLVRQGLNPRLHVLGVVLTMFDGRTRLSQQVADEVRRYFTEETFETVVPRSVRLSEAPSFGQPITEFDPSSRAARAYRRLASELASRLGLEFSHDHEDALDRLLRTRG